MLKLRLISSDLKTYDPRIESYLPKDLSDWNAQIREGFEQVKDSLRARDLDFRLMGVSLDLMRDPTSTADQNKLTSATQTVGKSWNHINGQQGFNRFVISVTAMTGSSGYSFRLDGSNDLEITDAVEPANWTALATLTPTATGELFGKIIEEYRYYRIVLTVPVTTPSMTFTACLEESYHDRWIAYRTLSLIYAMLSKDPTDTWQQKSNSSDAMFQSAFDSYLFSYDTSGDNQITKADVDQTAESVRLIR